MVGGYLISNVFAAPAEGAMFAGVMTEISGDSIPPAVFSVGITIILIIINLKGVNMSTFLQEIVASFMVVSLIILSIIGAFGIGTAIVIDSVSFFASAFILSFLQIREENLRRDKLHVKEYVAALKAGVVYLKEQPVIRNLCLLAVLLNAAIVPLNSLQSPLVQEVLGQAANCLVFIQ